MHCNFNIKIVYEISHFSLASDTDTDDNVDNKTAIETNKADIDIIKPVKEENNDISSSTESTTDEKSSTSHLIADKDKDKESEKSIVDAPNVEEKTKTEKKND